MEPVTAQEMITFRATIFPFANCVQASSGEGTESKNHQRRITIAGTDQVNLWKSGARFSLKAATPSFDSAVS